MSLTEEQENVVDIIALRVELKTWENQFREANGRKAGRADIKNDATIAAKYQLYDRSTRRTKLPAPSATPKKSTRHIESKQVLREKSSNGVSATPKRTPLKAKHVISELSVPSPIQEVEATPAFIRQALGPTPQKDGHVLGIFDLLSGGTPSRKEVKDVGDSHDAIAATPSKPTPLDFDKTFSKTPQSSGKRFFLDAFVGTPLKRKREDDIGTTSSSQRKFATPAFLRRVPLAKIDEESNDGPIAGPPFKRRGLTRSLSSMIQGLRKQEEERMDDEWDIMNEIEAEQAGEKNDRPAPKVLVKDSQTVDMPLGPDQAQESSEESAAEGESNTRKPWKKKGLKRQTRRVIMRPNFLKPKKVVDTPDSEDEVVAKTQPQDTPVEVGDEDEFADDLDSDGEDRATAGKKSVKEANPKKKSTAKKETDKDKETGKKPRKYDPNAQSHANFRKLKIKNQNTKAKGRRFGRR